MNSFQQVFNILRTRASSNLTADDLQALSGATSFAKSMALEAREVFMGIGSLVNEDQGGTGCLSNPEDVPCLAFHAANTFDILFSLIGMGEEAQQALSTRRHAALPGQIQAKAQGESA